MARILLADDSAAVLAAVGRLLRDTGHAVTSTNSGADVLCLLRHKPPPDLLILDLRMPGLDGRQVLKELGPTAPPVVVITGDGVGLADLAGPVVRVVRKPFDATEITAAVADALGEGRQNP